MILKKYLRLRCVYIGENCVFAGERVYQMLVKKKKKRIKNLKEKKKNRRHLLVLQPNLILC